MHSTAKFTALPEKSGDTSIITVKMLIWKTVIAFAYQGILANAILDCR
ncbi:MAG: hypothetical protein AB3A66_04015 [Nodularia sp. CChRGM 3473]